MPRQPTLALLGAAALVLLPSALPAQLRLYITPDTAATVPRGQPPRSILRGVSAATEPRTTSPSATSSNSRTNSPSTSLRLRIQAAPAAPPQRLQRDATTAVILPDRSRPTPQRIRNGDVQRLVPPAGRQPETCRLRVVPSLPPRRISDPSLTPTSRVAERELRRFAQGAPQPPLPPPPPPEAIAPNPLPQIPPPEPFPADPRHALTPDIPPLPVYPMMMAPLPAAPMMMHHGGIPQFTWHDCPKYAYTPWDNYCYEWHRHQEHFARHHGHWQGCGAGHGADVRCGRGPCSACQIRSGHCTVEGHPLHEETVHPPIGSQAPYHGDFSQPPHAYTMPTSRDAATPQPGLPRNEIPGR